MTDEQMIAYYNAKWPGVKRGALQSLSKEAELFYRAAYRRPRVLEAIALHPFNDWESMTDAEMIAHYKTKWPGVSRGKLPSVSKEANGFYQAASRRPKVFNAINRTTIEWSLMTDAEMIAHYNAKWPGVSRGKLQILSSESCAFYIAAYPRPVVLAAITRTRKNWASMTDVEMIAHYNTNWPGLSRGRLYRHSKDSKVFYKAASTRPGVIGAIPTRENLVRV